MAVGVLDDHVRHPLTLLVHHDAAHRAQGEIDERGDGDELPGDQAGQADRCRYGVTGELARVHDDVAERGGDAEAAARVRRARPAATGAVNQDGDTNQGIAERIDDRAADEGVPVGEVDAGAGRLRHRHRQIDRTGRDVAVQQQSLDVHWGAVGEDRCLDGVVAGSIGVGVVLVAVRAGGDHDGQHRVARAVEQVAGDRGVPLIDKDQPGDHAAVRQDERPRRRSRTADQACPDDDDRAGVRCHRERAVSRCHRGEAVARGTVRGEVAGEGHAGDRGAGVVANDARDGAVDAVDEIVSGDLAGGDAHERERVGHRRGVPAHGASGEGDGAKTDLEAVGAVRRADTGDRAGAARGAQGNSGQRGAPGRQHAGDARRAEAAVGPGVGVGGGEVDLGGRAGDQPAEEDRRGSGEARRGVGLDDEARGGGPDAKGVVARAVRLHLVVDAGVVDRVDDNADDRVPEAVPSEALDGCAVVVEVQSSVVADRDGLVRRDGQGERRGCLVARLRSGSEGRGPHRSTDGERAVGRSGGRLLGPAAAGGDHDDAGDRVARVVDCDARQVPVARVGQVHRQPRVARRDRAAPARAGGVAAERTRDHAVRPLPEGVRVATRRVGQDVVGVADTVGDPDGRTGHRRPDVVGHQTGDRGVPEHEADVGVVRGCRQVRHLHDVGDVVVGEGVRADDVGPARRRRVPGAVVGGDHASHDVHPADGGRGIPDHDHGRTGDGVARESRDHSGHWVVVDDIAPHVEVAVVLEVVPGAALPGRDHDRGRRRCRVRTEVEEARHVTADHDVRTGGGRDGERPVDVTDGGARGRQAVLPQGHGDARDRLAALVERPAADGSVAGVDDRLGQRGRGADAHRDVREGAGRHVAGPTQAVDRVRDRRRVRHQDREGAVRPGRDLDAEVARQVGADRGTRDRVSRVVDGTAVDRAVGQVVERDAQALPDVVRVGRADHHLVVQAGRPLVLRHRPAVHRVGARRELDGVAAGRVGVGEVGVAARIEGTDLHARGEHRRDRAVRDAVLHAPGDEPPPLPGEVDAADRAAAGGDADDGVRRGHVVREPHSVDGDVARRGVQRVVDAVWREHGVEEGVAGRVLDIRRRTRDGLAVEVSERAGDHAVRAPRQRDVGRLACQDRELRHWSGRVAGDGLRVEVGQAGRGRGTGRRQRGAGSVGHRQREAHAAVEVRREVVAERVDDDGTGQGNTGRLEGLDCQRGVPEVGVTRGVGEVG